MTSAHGALTKPSPDSSEAYDRDVTYYLTLSRKIVFYLLCWTVVAVVGFPIFWMVICSFKPGRELYSAPPTFLPGTWTLANYHDLFFQTEFPTYMLNTLTVACSATLLSLIIGAMGAYTLSRFDFWPIRLFSRAALVSYMLPEVLLVLPLFAYVVWAGLADTLLSLIIANTAFTLPLTLWFMRSYFNAIPVSMEESAMVDGCTRLGAAARVTLPLALPGLVAVGVFSFNHAWNEFLFALVFTSSENKKVLSLGLSTWIGQDNIYSWGMLLSAGVMITIPVVAAFMAVERKLISGMGEGSGKG